MEGIIRDTSSTVRRRGWGRRGLLGLLSALALVVAPLTVPASLEIITRYNLPTRWIDPA